MADNEEPLDRVMVIAAHPDDPEFGCGGTIGKWAAAGKKITYVLLTSGDKGTHDPHVHPAELIEVREREQRAAAAELGVETVIFLRHPDLMLENTMALRRQLAGVIREYRPHILLAIDPWRHYQLHPDHRAAGFAALDALYAARECHVFPEQLVGEIEPWRVREAYLFWTEHPDHYEDITDYVAQRVASLRHHASQIRNPEKLEERIREGTAKVGEAAGFAHAEALKKFSFG
jgi:LmbE family N-acetylglucosaminyl deacetylase